MVLVVLVLMPNTSEAASGSGHCGDDSAMDIWLSGRGSSYPTNTCRACCSCTNEDYWFELDCKRKKRKFGFRVVFHPHLFAVPYGGEGCECIASNGALYLGDVQAVAR